MAMKYKKQWTRWNKPDQKTKTSREVVTYKPGCPEHVVVIGNVKARIWSNDGAAGPEWKIDCGYVYSTGSNAANFRAGFTNSIPLNAVPDAARALKKAYRVAMRGKRKRRWLAIFLFRW